jgi:hypothetical protein
MPPRMTEAELKRFVTAEIERAVAQALKPMARDIAEIKALARTQKLVEEKHHAEITALFEKEWQMQQASLLKLAEIERRLGIDPAASEIDPQYRN